jgi:hypothetical protein
VTTIYRTCAAFRSIGRMYNARSMGGVVLLGCPTPFAGGLVVPKHRRFSRMVRIKRALQLATLVICRTMLYKVSLTSIPEKSLPGSDPCLTNPLRLGYSEFAIRTSY